MTFPKPPPNAVGQLVEHAPTHTVVFDLGSSPPAELFRLYVTMSGPLAVQTASGPNVFGMTWQVTEPGCSLAGYSLWCCPTGQDVTPIEFATLVLTDGFTGTVLPGSVVTGPTQVQDQFNDVLLPAPVPLTAGAVYLVQYGIVNGWPFSASFWGAGAVAYNGLTNGPLQAFGDVGSSRPAPFGRSQCTVLPGTSDPTSGVGNAGASGFNAWVDVLVSTG